MSTAAASAPRAPGAPPAAKHGLLSLRRRRALLPYVLMGPGIAWLLIFFAIPIVNQLWVSLQTGNADTGFSQSYNWSVYPDAVSQYTEQLGRSFGYAATATVLCLIISFPLAYFIAFKSGRWKNVLLLLIILPFFTSYIVRTVAWQTILSDDGWLVHRLEDVGLVASGGRLLATRTAVIAGITYNFLPFMALPLYVALEKIDRRLIEAATDLYASRATAFRKVTLPLALPGVFAGTLLTFIPALGDYINAQLLGSSQQYMIGNVVQSQYLVVRDYPVAAALSFVLMAIILVGIAIYARLLGTKTLRESVA
jgi:spermidine/putrescine transport system permease protein